MRITQRLGQKRSACLAAGLMYRGEAQVTHLVEISAQVLGAALRTEVEEHLFHHQVDMVLVDAKDVRFAPKGKGPQGPQKTRVALRKLT